MGIRGHLIWFFGLLIATAVSLGADERTLLSNIRETEFSKPAVLKFSDVKRLIQEKQVITVSRFLELLPENYRKHYTLFYKSHSLQPATPLFPRVIVYGGDGRFLMTFAGNPQDAAYYTVEAAELDESHSEYQFYRIHFDQNGNKKPEIEISPSICKSCHGSKPRPIWDAYPFWRGAYGSRSHNKLDRISNGSLEHQFYQQFLATERDRGIYAHFPKSPGNEELKKRTEQKGHAVTFTPNGSVNDPTAFLSEQLGEIRMRIAAKEIKAHPRFAQFKYPLAFAALCENSVLPQLKVTKVDSSGKFVSVREPNPSFITPEAYLPAKESKELRKFWDSYFKRSTADHELRSKEAVFYNPVSKIPHIGSLFPADESDLNNFGAIRHEHKATWVYILGLMGIDPRNWAMTFDHGALALEEGGPPAYLRLGYLLFLKNPEIEQYFLVDQSRYYKQSTPEGCAELAGKSLLATKLLSSEGVFVNPDAILTPPTPILAELPQGVPAVVRRCLECHSFTAGATPIPFDRPSELAFALKNPSTTAGKNLIDDLIERIDSGDMPRRGTLSNAEKVEIKSYVKSLIFE